jgi:hypothetical protein
VGTAHFTAPVLAGGDRSGSLSNVAGGRSTGGHALHAGSEGVKVSEQGGVAREGWPGLEQC